MKKFLFFVLSFLSFLYSKDLEKIYLESGIEAVQKAIEANLQSKDYWQKHLSQMDLKYGYYDSDIFIVVVDKQAKNFYLKEYKDGKLDSKAEHKVLTGLMGDKLLEGDLKTPIGVYEITRRFVPEDTYYGPVAFNLSYPNLFDKLRDRTGGGIWIHGFPLNGNIREDVYKTKGCVVMPNDLLLNLESILKDNGGMVLINERGVLEAKNEDIALIFAELFKWKEAWTNSDIDKYLSFYDNKFKRYDGVGFDKFKEMKKSIFSRKESKFIQFTQFSITPYPTIGDENIFRVSFMEKYRASAYKFDGVKTLYVKLDGGKMKILIEQ
ncbi:hypothetical protein CR44_07815 [Campylobacter fetus subsp. testudinum]|uniref:L,D-transpeptidase family protein n=1 Tax=Campylobacter fetus TaxID=196 RepID=UPI00057E72E6|nr:L,D-transpeptidase family protein [Campylobacter fetus]AJB46109.1 hypothetical protein CR44_07815 [Campylobacter fetus subsp. testudinum]